MACKTAETKYVKFTFETGEASGAAAMSSVRFAIKTDDALEAVGKSADAARALFGGLQFKCKSVDVSSYGE